MTLVASNWRFLFDYNLCAKRISVPFMAVNNKNILTALTAYKKPAVKEYFFIINSVSQVNVGKLPKMKFLSSAVQLLWLIFIIPDFVATVLIAPYPFALLSHKKYSRRVRNPLLRSE